MLAFARERRKPVMIAGASRKAAAQEDKGIVYADLSQEEPGLLLAVIEEYVGAQPKVLAQQRIERLRAAGLNRICLLH